MTPNTPTDAANGLDLAALYEADETYWLEETARRIRAGRLGALDYDHLAEYLEDMGKRDRREVKSRLRVLLTHLLKWHFQPTERSRSWQATILEQRDELTFDMTSGTLRNHAEAVLADAYRIAVKLAATETGLPESAFPQECPYTLDQALTDELPHAS